MTRHLFHRAHVGSTRHDPQNYEGRADAMRQLFVEQVGAVMHCESFSHFESVTVAVKVSH